MDRARSDALLRHIGLRGRPVPDPEGLRRVVRAFIARIAYENLGVQLGETGPLDAQALTARVLEGGRGGYCFEMNTVLCALLRALGFAVQRRQGVVGEPGARAGGALTNHMALVVSAAGGSTWLADAGLGEGPLDPLALRAGPARSGGFRFSLERDGEGWWLAHDPHGSFTGMWFADAPSRLGDFAPHHLRLSTAPESSFVQTLVVQRPRPGRLVSLRARTLSQAGPGAGPAEHVESVVALAGVLAEQFGIDPGRLGAERLERLWRAACAQHERWLRWQAARA
jgi:N-hydroxyarylamine O-acetyltransferase